MPSRQSCLFALAFLLPVIIPAPGRAEIELGVALRLQMGVGGDTFATVTYSDGSESDLKMGTYATVAAGVVVTPLSYDIHALDFELLGGWASWSTGPENTEDRIKLARLPVEALAFYRVAPTDMPVRVRLGGGVAYHLVGSVSGSGSLDSFEADVDNALGWVAELSVLYDVFGFSLRYTGMRYEVRGLADPLDASSVAGAIFVVFPVIGGAEAPPAKKL